MKLKLARSYFVLPYYNHKYQVTDAIFLPNANSTYTVVILIRYLPVNGGQIRSIDGVEKAVIQWSYCIY